MSHSLPFDARYSRLPTKSVYKASGYKGLSVVTSSWGRSVFDHAGHSAWGRRASRPKEARRRMSIQESIDRSPFSRRQVFIVGLCCVLNAVEGFDVFVMALSAAGVTTEWGLTGSQLGTLLSATPVGMAIGAFFLAPLADRVGRRPFVIWCLVLCGVGMALAVAAPAYGVLLVARLLTGLGVGGVSAGLPVILAEYTPQRRRGTVIALYAAGPSFGGVIGGAASAYLLTEYGWRSPFVVGAVLTLAGIAAVVTSLPESIAFLLARRPRNALAEANRLLARIRQPELSELPAETTARESAGNIRAAVLGRRVITKTLLIWIAYFCTQAVYFFANSWTPKLLQSSGASAGQAAQSGILLNVGGIIATLLFAAFALKLTTRLLTTVVLFGAAGSLLLMNVVFGNLSGVLMVAILLGLCLNASMAGIYAIVPDLYPALVRATAVGWAIGAGRIGAILAPLLAGMLLDRQWTAGNLLVLFAAPAVAAALAVLAVTRTRRPELPEAAQSVPVTVQADGGSRPAS
ncbi:MFS transporter [Thermopolyspora sp. NPDC052614]|uniref:MFS transporter n=1 Tax=Thermopolyspora sp. NPDC052614 TaxID=3155682 RepID=UPI00342DCB8F